MNLMIPEVTIEECAEVIQAITKIMRFGFVNTGYDNRRQLEEEIGQLQYMLEKLTQEWDLHRGTITEACNQKAYQLSVYAKYNVCNQNQPEPSVKS